MLPEDVKKAAVVQAANIANQYLADPAYPNIKDAIDRMTKAIAEATQKATSGKMDATVLLGLESEYAVGKGLISREDLTSFRNQYLSQSQLSLGLIPALLFLIFALLVDVPDLADYWPALLLIGAMSGSLFFLAIERRHKYRTDLKLQLLGRIQKLLEADQAAKDAKKSAADKTTPASPDPVRKAIQEELKNLQLEVKPLVVELHTKSETAKPLKTKDAETADKKEPSAGGAAKKS